MSDDVPEWLDEELWKDFIAHRKEMNAPMGETAKKRALIKLYRMKEAGEDINTVLEQSIERGWKGLFPAPPDQKPPPQKEFYEAQEPEITEEQRQKNLERVNEMIKVVNISGDRRR